MAIDTFEVQGLERTDAGNASQIIRFYRVHGVSDDEAARNAIFNESPSSFRTLLRRKIEVTEVGPDEWLGEVEYGSPGGLTPSPSDLLVSFSASTTTQHITHGEPVSSTGNTNPFIEKADYNGAINVRHTDGEAPEVDGIDVLVPTFTFSVRKLVSQTEITDAWIDSLSFFVGTTNQLQFGLLRPREVLLTGVTGQQNDSLDYNLEYQMAVSKNVTNLKIGDSTTVPQKDGWDVLSVVTRPMAATGERAIQPIVVQADVNRVYRSTNWPAFLGLI